MDYNGHSSTEYGVIFNDYPSFSGAKKQYTTSAIAGMVGELVGKDTGVSNLEISCVFSVVNDNFFENIRAIKKWLYGSGKLKFSDMDDTFYRVLKINYGEIEREMRYFGTFTVTFTCIPYEYRDDGNAEWPMICSNPYSTCKPIYRINGEGMCTLAVNGKSVKAQVGQNLTIDSEKMICYRNDGTLANVQMQGDYEDLWLPNGSCDISVSSGFDLSIIPQWGYAV